VGGARGGEGGGSVLTLGRAQRCWYVHWGLGLAGLAICEGEVESGAGGGG